MNRLRRHRGNSLVRAALMRSAENASHHHQQQQNGETKKILLHENISTDRSEDSFALRRMMSTESTGGVNMIERTIVQ